MPSIARAAVQRVHWPRKRCSRDDVGIRFGGLKRQVTNGDAKQYIAQGQPLPVFIFLLNVRRMGKVDVATWSLVGRKKYYTFSFAWRFDKWAKCLSKDKSPRRGCVARVLKKIAYQTRDKVAK